MAFHVCQGAMLQCSFGAAPSTLNVIPIHRVTTSAMPAATINDHLPFVNILPFGLCSSPSNPTVIAATAAKFGVFTPMPCVPVTPSPWITGSPTVVMGGIPTLQNTSKLLCNWAGLIQVLVPGQFTEMIP